MPALLVGAAIGAAVTVSLRSVPAVAPTRSSSSAAASPRSSSWAALRRTACDDVPIVVPPSASIGTFAGRPVNLLRTLSERRGLAQLANDLNLTGRAAELGVWRGEFAEQFLKVWRGQQYVLVDLWTPSDCVNGNRSACVYGGNVSDGGVAERSFDKMITGLRMQRLGPKWSGRYLLLQNSTLEAATRFPDGHFDYIYLDATHTYAAAAADLEAWYPKLRLGGLVAGHDYQFQHQAIGDGYVFGVRDAVDEFAQRRNLRVYSTMESYLPSFYFLKCTLW